MTPYDRFAHTNPAFGALCLHWVADGYQQAAEGRTDAPRSLSPVWGIVALVLLAPLRVRERLPESGAKRLTNLLSENPEWRLSLPDAMRACAGPFWSSVKFGVATGILSLDEGRLRPKGKPARPSGEMDRNLRKRATALGKVLAREGTDSAVSLAIGITVT